MPPNNSRRAFSADDGSNGKDTNQQLGAGSSSSEDDQESSNTNSSSRKSHTKCSDEKSTDNDDDSETTTCFGDLSSEQDDDSSSKGSNAQTTNAGWIAAASAAAAAAAVSVYAMEKHRQKQLTKVPLVMGQIPQGSRIKSVCDQLTSNHGKSGILSQPIVPSLFVGTHGQLASAAAFLNPGPKLSRRFSERLVSSYDGAQILLDWEIPPTESPTTRKTDILKGRISHPTILILHGINNSSDYGYIKCLQKTMTSRGWNSVAMNFRGTARGGRQPMTTPRSYTASYTGDLRSVVHQLVGKMSVKQSENNHTNHNKNNKSIVPLFLVGNSLGANLVTKYLGEEGLAGTLPENVMGGISLGNPFSFRSNYVGFPFGHVMGVARKFNYFCQRKPMSMNYHSQSSNSVHGDPTTITLASLDQALAPTMVRTVPHPPFATKIGYGHAKNGDENTSNQNNTSALTAGDDHWADSSSYQQGRHVSVPLLHVIARDDNLCFDSARYFLHYTLQNPNAMIVQTRTGGHLGWWHNKKKSSATKASRWGLDSWTDGVTADFIQAILDTQKGQKEIATFSGAIDDAYNLYAKSRNNSNTSNDDESKTANFIGEDIKSSMRRFSGDRDSDSSTIDTNDQARYKFYSNNSRRTTTIEDLRPSETYIRFQQVLLSQQYQGEEEQQQLLERNRLFEKRESIKLSRLHRSRL